MFLNDTQKTFNLLENMRLINVHSKKPHSLLYRRNQINSHFCYLWFSYLFFSKKSTAAVVNKILNGSVVET